MSNHSINDIINQTNNVQSNLHVYIISYHVYIIFHDKNYVGGMIFVCSAQLQRVRQMYSVHWLLKKQVGTVGLH